MNKDILKPHHWKVPFRSVYCWNFSQWVHETLYCLFVIKFFKKEMNDLMENARNGKFTKDFSF